MPNVSVTRIAAMALVLATAPLGAQATGARCTPLDTTAKWYAKQRQWSGDSKHTWTNDSLRTVLVHAAGLDANPTAGAGALLGYEIVGATRDPAQGDAASVITLLRGLAQTRGSTWPTKSVVGAQGVRGVWLLASRDSLLARVALHRMMEAGPEESPPAGHDPRGSASDSRGSKTDLCDQLVKSPYGKLEPAPLEDPKHVDLRRDAAGLPPLAQAICAASRK